MQRMVWVTVMSGDKCITCMHKNAHQNIVVSQNGDLHQSVMTLKPSVDLCVGPLCAIS